MISFDGTTSMWLTGILFTALGIVLGSIVTYLVVARNGRTRKADGLGCGPTTWMEVPGDPRNNYLARMDWAANSTELTIEQLNRRQTVNTLWFANAASGKVRSVLVDTDSAWIDIYDDHTAWGPGPSLHWTPDGSRFIWVTERDGWRHAWLVDRTGSFAAPFLLTAAVALVGAVVYVAFASGRKLVD